MKMRYIYKLRRKHFSSLQSVGVIALLIVITLSCFLLMDNSSHNLDHHHPSESPSPNSDNSDDNSAFSTPIWYRISDSIHVYSAHFDPRIQNGPQLSPNMIPSTFSNNFSLIRIIGIKKFPSLNTIRLKNPLAWLRIKEETYFHEEYECKLFMSTSTNSTTTTISSSLLTYHVFEEGIKSFAAVFFNCYFNQTMATRQPQLSPLFVALVPKYVSEYPNKLIQVEVNFPTPVTEVNSTSSSIAVCVRPLFSSPEEDLTLESRLIQFISYYVAMGVGSFNFYDLSIFPQVRKYLRRFIRQPHFRRDNSPLLSNIRFRVHVQRWNLPTGNSSELWDYGTLAALNDCLYRNMRADHVIFLDLDEFIVPQEKHEDNQLPELFNYLEKVGSGREAGEGIGKNLPPPAQIIFRNTFFCSEFCRQGHRDDLNRDGFDLIPPLKAFPITTCTTRTKRVWNEKFRSKFAVRPTSIISVGHHTSHNFWRGQRATPTDPRMGQGPTSITADTRIALLNHYRDCGPISTRKHPIFNRLTVKDDYILRILRNKNFKWFIP